MTKLFYESILFRNLIFFVLIGCLIAGLNSSGIVEVWQQNPSFILEFVGFYTITYLLCCVHNRLLYERFLNRKHYSTYFLLCVTVVLVFTFLVESKPPFAWQDWLNTFIGGFLIIFFGFGLYVIFKSVFWAQWYLKSNLSNTQNELAVLRNQLNPHFLFNALNNLYGVSLSAPEKVSGYILMLSELLRYQVDGSKKERVKLTDEINFLNQFVDYERLKLAHRGSFQLALDIPESTLVIAPLILFQFVENAFKFSGQQAEPTVAIQIHLNGNKLYFQCANTYNKVLSEKYPGTQTGIENVRQRLLLQYPKQHTLLIHKDDMNFSVQLQIMLTDGKV